MNDPISDVLICGAGPVGLTLASQLARHGVPFRIIDRKGCRTDLSKALVLWARSLESLDTCLPAERFVRNGLPVRKALFRAGEEDLASLDLRGEIGAFPTGVMLPQAETERILEEHLQQQGFSVAWQTELLDFKDEGDGIEATLRHSHGGRETIHSGWLVGCDGAHSLVRERLGLPFQGEIDLHRWYLADLRIVGRLPDAEVVICWHEEGVLALFHLGGDRWRVISETTLEDPDLPTEDPSLGQIQDLVNRRGPRGLKLFEPTWLSEFRVNERKVDRYRVGRVFLAGDSAHIHSPAGGQGMNTGMQDACNLAWKLALAQAGLAGEKLLDSYTDERSEIGARVVKATTRLTEIATLRHPMAQWLRNLLTRTALSFDWLQERTREHLSELDVAYPASPVNGRHDRKVCLVKPGSRVPAIPLQALDGQPAHLGAIFRDPRLLLMTWGATPGSAARLMDDLPKAWQPGLRPLDLLPEAWDQAAPQTSLLASPADLASLGLQGSGYLVARPDGYLALSAPLNNGGALGEWLATIGGDAPSARETEKN